MSKGTLDIARHLRADERVLWQGAPEQKFVVGFIQIIALLVLGVWIGGFVFNIPEMLGNDTPKLAIAAGVIASLFTFIATLLGPWQQRQRSLYALSTQRAFIRFRWPLLGPRLYSWPITNGMSFHIVRPEPLSLYFAEHRFLNTNPPLRFGFQRIAEGEAVLKMMADIRDGKHGGYIYAAPSPSDNGL